MDNAKFDLGCSKIDNSSLDFSESRTYFNGLMFTPVLSEIRPGHTQPLHRHNETIEWVLVLEGEICFVEGDTEIDVRAGDAVLFTPSPNLFHTMLNRSKLPARYLTVKSPVHGVDLSVMAKDRIEPN